MIKQTRSIFITSDNDIAEYQVRISSIIYTNIKGKCGVSKTIHELSTYTSGSSFAGIRLTIIKMIIIIIIIIKY